jgi:hypothetical protein
MTRQPSFFDFVCSNADKFALLFVMEVLAGLLSLAIFFATAPGTAARVVTILNLAGVAVIGSFTAALLRKCHRR